MDNQDKQTFSWVVKQGSILLFADHDKIHLEINKENNPTCLLTKSDSEEVISILTELASSIWEQPGYVKEPYAGRRYVTDSNGKVYWDINETRLFVGLNAGHDAMEMNYEGDHVLKLPVNYAVEIIQIMTHFSDQL